MKFTLQHWFGIAMVLFIFGGLVDILFAQIGIGMILAGGAFYIGTQWNKDKGDGDTE